MAEDFSNVPLEEVAVDDSPPSESEVRARPTDHAREVDAEQFGALLDRLHPDRERAWIVYAGVRERLTRFFADKNCLSPVECADDTLDRAARRLATGTQLTVEDPYQYLLGIAYNVLREYWKNAERKAVELDALTLAHHPAHHPADERRAAEAHDEHERRLECLARCLSEQTPEQRDFLNAYHTGASGAERIEERRRLAARLGLELNALRIRACRARDRLEKCLRTCLARRDGGEKS